MREIKKNKIPTISVISANYNNGEFLDEFFLWLERSTVLPGEVIVVDDGSNDNSVQKLQSYQGILPLKCFFFNQNKGFSAALNYAVEKSSGKFLLRIDPDDLIHPDRIEKQFSFLQRNPEFDVIGSNAYYFHRKPPKSFFETNVPLHSAKIVALIENGEIPLLHSCLMGKREVFEKHPFKDSKYPLEDYQFYCDLVKSNVRLANMPELLTFVRIHPKSISSGICLERTRELFLTRDKSFGKKTSAMKIYLSYIHARMYRKFLMSESVIKWLWLFIAGILKPERIISRIVKR